MYKKIFSALIVCMLFCFVCFAGCNTYSANNGASTETQLPDNTPSKEETNPNDASDESNTDTDDTNSSTTEGGNTDENKPQDPNDTQPDENEPQPTKSKFAGTWYGWVLDIQYAAECRLEIDDGGALLPSSYYRYGETTEIEWHTVRFSDADAQTAQTDTTYTTEWRGGKLECALVDDALQIKLFAGAPVLQLTKADTILLTDFMETLPAVYVGEEQCGDQTFAYEFAFSREEGGDLCVPVLYAELYFTADIQAELLYASNGIIYTCGYSLDEALSEYEAVYSLLFDKTARTLTFTASPGGTSLILQAQ